MTATEAWEKLVLEGRNQPISLKTKRGLNFTIISNGEILIVKNSEIEPSCKLKSSRSIVKENFEKVFPYYSSWKIGEKGISKEITAITVNSVYIMAAIDYLMNIDMLLNN